MVKILHSKTMFHCFKKHCFILRGLFHDIAHFSDPLIQKAKILFLIKEYYSLSVLSEKLYILEISPVYQKLWSFKCMFLKTLNSNFLD